jgi:hypothetical protein
MFVLGLRVPFFRWLFSLPVSLGVPYWLFLGRPSFRLTPKEWEWPDFSAGQDLAQLYLRSLHRSCYGGS